MTAETLAAAVTFAAAFAALFAAHSFGDHWVQTHGQACAKGAPGWAGRWACAKHVATLPATKLIALAAVALITGLHLNPAAVAIALLIDAASHYWADRRTPLQRLATQLGKQDFYQLGAGHLGSGSHALDQSWHHLWIFVATLIIAGGA
ncbi:transcriptional regulator [Streptosporangium sp. NBC_01755]|uniref:transcriptional regulator n=1 Tax=Streptosporangium sp. NBC_01755 TaxID=2975949 RepID=UPI002DDC2876|nr:transcriptional regulator [Streptosporangium sp. NBC_01755]WSD03894.1 transcriptional regulator [Streptosporangium sp. NBC_01755]